MKHWRLVHPEILEKKLVVVRRGELHEIGKIFRPLTKKVSKNTSNRVYYDLNVKEN